MTKADLLLAIKDVPDDALVTIGSFFDDCIEARYKLVKRNGKTDMVINLNDEEDES